MKKILIILVLLFVIGCTSNVAVNDVADNTVTTEEVDIKEAGEVKEFDIEAFQFGFEPSVIEVNQGDVVKITAKSRDVPHGLKISAFNVNMALDKNPKTIEFVANRKGEFDYFCSIPCGSGHGKMRGKLVVN